MAHIGCHNCAHFFVHKAGDQLDPDVSTCTAFYPDPIPEDIMSGDFWHDEPHPLQQNRAILYLSLSPFIEADGEPADVDEGPP
jgi:hypothetical protein